MLFQQGPIERLLLLPGTTKTTSGIVFSTPVLAFLRKGFKTHWTEEDRQEVISFIAQKVDEAEPKLEDKSKPSLAHLKWQAMKQRIRLELEPDRAVQALVCLSDSPIGMGISTEMERICGLFRDHPPGDSVPGSITRTDS